MSRPSSSRARAILGAGAVGTTLLAGVATAGAQQEAPAPAASPAGVTAAPAPVAKKRTHIKVLRKRMNVAAGRKARVHGRLAPARAGRKVRLQKWSKGRWRTIAADRTSQTGRYAIALRLRQTDIRHVRLTFAGDRTGRATSRRIGRLRVFRPALASWYGPGLYGNHLGCGGRLGYGTVGVAHKSLPCGTKVVLRKGNRYVRTRVIDRGPYVGAREFDLTAATKRKLGFGSTGTVWVAH